MKTALGRVVCEAAASADEPPLAVRSVVREAFLDAPALARYPERDAGLVLLRMREGVLDVLWAHTTPSMIVAYATSRSRKPRGVVSRKEAHERIVVSGTKCVCGGEHATVQLM